MTNENNTGNQRLSDQVGGKPTLPDFDTLRDLARNDPEGLERLRLALCSKVIDEAPPHAKARLEGLMFQINARRQLAKSEQQACEDISEMMNESLQRMQMMLKDLRTIQSESILLTTRKQFDVDFLDQTPESSAVIIPFSKRKS